MQPTIQQLSSLMMLLKNDEGIARHWNLEDERFYDNLHTITLKQYKFILALLFNKKYIKLNGVFQQWNMPRKQKQTYDQSNSHSTIF